MPELIDIIRNERFDPARRRTEYADWSALWQLYLDLVEPDRDKIAALVEKHHDDEDEAKHAIRKALATAFNLCPTILDVIRLYLYSEEPVIDVGEDEQLAAFIADCDGNGTRWIDWVRNTVLPMQLAMGWVDCLVQNPRAAADPATQADADAAGLKPRAFAVLPLQRSNWSCDPTDRYNWLTFADRVDESPTPFADAGESEALITLLAAGKLAGARTDAAAWIRSTKSGQSAQWQHEAGYCPTKRVPVSTIYYQKSNDPARRHFGLSKIAMAATLTHVIIQILSWVHEDILANLAITCLPSVGGKPPTDANGNAAVTEMTAFSVLWIDSEAKSAPMVLQGDVAHIKAKLELAQTYVKEVLRLSHLAGVYGEAAGEEKSGFHAVVNRSELTNELSDLAGQLDRFTLETLALAKSWATGEDWTVEKLKAANPKLVARWFKGPYNTEPLEQILKDAAASIDMLGELSGTYLTNAMKSVARACVYQDDPELGKILEEIEAATKGMPIAGKLSQMMAAAAAINAGDMSGNVSEGGGSAGGIAGE